MTSVVDTSVKFFNSLMAGAPVLNGTVGALIALLDACLVNGFDVKTSVTITVVSGVATVTFTGTHSSQIDSVVLISGVTGPLTALNGEQKVTGRPLPTTTTFATAAADGSATGTISMSMAPLGWAKVFSGTNKAVYRSTDPMSSGMYLRVDDTVATTSRVIGYETMTDVDTGLGPFPTNVQVGNGGVWAKSANATATAVVWHLIGDTRAFYHAIQVSSSGNAVFQMAPIRGFGDPVALRPGGDPWAAFLNYSTSLTAATNFDGCLGNNSIGQAASPKSYTALGSGVLQSAQIWGLGILASHYSGVTDMHGPFPNRVDGALYLSKSFLSENGGIYPRSELPGFYALTQSALFTTFKAGDKTIGTGALAGRTLMALNCIGSTVNMNTTSTTANTGVAMIDITGPWR